MAEVRSSVHGGGAEFHIESKRFKVEAGLKDGSIVVHQMGRNRRFTAVSTRGLCKQVGEEIINRSSLLGDVGSMVWRDRHYWALIEERRNKWGSYMEVWLCCGGDIRRFCIPVGKNGEGWRRFGDALFWCENRAHLEQQQQPWKRRKAGIEGSIRRKQPSQRAHQGEGTVGKVDRPSWVGSLGKFQEEIGEEISGSSYLRKGCSVSWKFEPDEMKLGWRVTVVPSKEDGDGSTGDASIPFSNSNFESLAELDGEPGEVATRHMVGAKFRADVDQPRIVGWGDGVGTSDGYQLDEFLDGGNTAARSQVFIGLEGPWWTNTLMFSEYGLGGGSSGDQAHSCLASTGFDPTWEGVEGSPVGSSSSPGDGWWAKVSEFSGFSHLLLREPCRDIIIGDMADDRVVDSWRGSMLEWLVLDEFGWVSSSSAPEHRRSKVDGYMDGEKEVVSQGVELLADPGCSGGCLDERAFTPGASPPGNLETPVGCVKQLDWSEKIPEADHKTPSTEVVAHHSVSTDSGVLAKAKYGYRLSFSRRKFNKVVKNPNSRYPLQITKRGEVSGQPCDVNLSQLRINQAVDNFVEMMDPAGIPGKLKLLSKLYKDMTNTLETGKDQEVVCDDSLGPLPSSHDVEEVIADHLKVTDSSLPPTV